MTGGLTITDVERVRVNVPFTDRCQRWNALKVWDWSVVEVIRLSTDAGLIGYGETLPFYTWRTVSAAAIERVKGRNPAEFLGDDSLGAGLQMAIYDVVGKALDVPISALLPGPQVRDWAPIAWWNTKMPPDELAAEAREAVAAGYTAHKFKARPWLDVEDQVDAVSTATPESFALDLDWNEMLLSAGEAVRVLRKLDRYERTAIYESPIPHSDLEGYQLLRRQVERPLAVHFKSVDYPCGVREQMCDGYVIEGGVANALRQGELAAEFNKQFWLQLVGTGLTTALVGHLGAVLTHAHWPAVTALNNYTDDLIVEPLHINGGYLRVPTGPGLGVEVDEDALTRFAVPADFSIPEPRHVLSVIWPDGRVVHYASMNQCWTDFKAGNHPVYVRGVRMEVWPEDSSPEWAELYARAQQGPVHDRRTPQGGRAGF